MKKHLYFSSLLILYSLISFNLLGCDTKPNNSIQDNPSPTPTVASSPNNPQNIAQQTTVYIKGPAGGGSGVIIGHQQNTYYVLTAKHVVRTPPGEIEDDYIVQTPDDQQYSVQYDTQIIQDKQLDLALIKFNSENDYSVASLNNNLSPQQPVYVSGWKDCLSDPKYEFNPGQVEAILSSVSQFSKNNANKVDNPKEYYNQGYKVKYTNLTIRGMSGGAILNQNNQVVAIHGLGGEYRNNQYDFEKCPPLNEAYSQNFGIPIKAFLDSELSQQIPYIVSQVPSPKLPVPKKDPKSQPPPSQASGGIFLRPDSLNKGKEPLSVN